MTTEPRRSRWRLWPLLGTALVAWFAALAVVTRVFEPSNTVVVAVWPGHEHKLLSDAHVQVIEVRGPFMIVSGTQPGFVSELYGAGALGVIPATSGGCRGRLRSGSASRSAGLQTLTWAASDGVRVPR